MIQPKAPLEPARGFRCSSSWFISKENGLGKAKMLHKPYPTDASLGRPVYAHHTPDSSHI